MESCDVYKPADPPVSQVDSEGSMEVSHTQQAEGELGYPEVACRNCNVPTVRLITFFRVL